MPAYSYKERFVPFILDLSKDQTIRKRRKKGFAKVGNTLYHYQGLRTRFCRKLGESICSDVKTIIIKKNGAIIIFEGRLSDQQCKKALRGNQMGNKMSEAAADLLAYRDGFRNEEKIYPTSHYSLMIRWWKQTHSLPFIGDLIRWDKSTFKEALTARIIKKW